MDAKVAVETAHGAPAAASAPSGLVSASIELRT